MPEKSPQGHQEELFDLLAYLSGHLEIASSRDEHALQALDENLSRALTHEELPLSVTVSRRFHVFLEIREPCRNGVVFRGWGRPVWLASSSRAAQ